MAAARRLPALLQQAHGAFPDKPQRRMLACTQLMLTLLLCCQAQVTEGSLSPQLVGTLFTVQPARPAGADPSTATAAAASGAQEASSSNRQLSFSWEAMAEAADGDGLVASVSFPGDGRALFRSAEGGKAARSK